MKPLDAFQKRKNSKQGRRASCRECVNAQTRARYARDPDKRREYARRYRENDRDRFREYQRRWRERNPAYDSEWRKRNRRLAVEQTRDWQRRNSEVVAEISRRRRARLREAAVVDFTVHQLEARLSMFPGCWICGGEPEAVDHVKPLAAGGPHTLSNLRPVCTSCNSSKRDRWPWPAPTRKAR